MNIKKKTDQSDFEWTKAELQASKKINSLPISLQHKIASRKFQHAQSAKAK